MESSNAMGMPGRAPDAGENERMHTFDDMEAGSRAMERASGRADQRKTDATERATSDTGLVNVSAKSGIGE